MGIRGLLAATTTATTTALVVALTGGHAPAAPPPAGATTCGGLAVSIAGSHGDDDLVGTEGPDVIHAGGGNDVVRALGGDDVVCGGDGADVLLGGDGADRLHGQRDRRARIDGVRHELEGDLLDGGPGDDLLDVGADPRSGDHIVDDEISYATSAVPVHVDLAAGTATGDGTDTIVGRVHLLEGSDHADVLLGADARDWITGLGGADRLEGRGGSDALDAVTRISIGPERTLDPSPDHLVGGPGESTDAGPGAHDTYVWTLSRRLADARDSGGGIDLRTGRLWVRSPGGTVASTVHGWRT